MLLLQDRFRSLAHFIDCLNDINPRRLGVAPSRVYEMLLQVPLQVTRRAAFRLLSRENHERLEQIFDTHEAPEGYIVRDALLFGIAECRRAETFLDHLAQDDVSSVGESMRASHDAERALARSTAAGAALVTRSATDAYLRDLIDDLSSEAPQRVQRAQLERQTGRYGSSTPAIDRVVDAARDARGVLGAQLSGSGLGGCVMVLMREDAGRSLARALGTKAKSAKAQIVAPVAGSGVIQT